MKSVLDEKEWVYAGQFGVDSGLCWIGDPCYILHKSEPEPGIGKDWDEFCEILEDGPTQQFNFRHGAPGLGVVTSTGYGDGSYPVYVRYEGRRVAQVLVDFMGVFEDEAFEDEDAALDEDAEGPC